MSDMWDAEDRAIARALDAASDAETAGADEHLVDEYRDVLGRMPVPEVTPAADLEDRMVAAALDRRPGTTSTLDAGRTRRTRRIRLAALAIASVAAAVVIGLIVQQSGTTGNAGARRSRQPRDLAAHRHRRAPPGAGDTNRDVHARPRSGRDRPRRQRRGLRTDGDGTGGDRSRQRRRHDGGRTCDTVGRSNRVRRRPSRARDRGDAGAQRPGDRACRHHDRVDDARAAQRVAEKTANGPVHDQRDQQEREPEPTARRDLVPQAPHPARRGVAERRIHDAGSVADRRLRAPDRSRGRDTVAGAAVRPLGIGHAGRHERGPTKPASRHAHGPTTGDGSPRHSRPDDRRCERDASRRPRRRRGEPNATRRSAVRSARRPLVSSRRWQLRSRATTSSSRRVRARPTAPRRQPDRRSER